MFQLHESTQRRVFRAAFLALCVLPALGLALVGTARRTAGHRAQVEQDLTLALGLRAEIDRVEYPEPGVMRLVGLRLSTQRGSEPVAKCDAVEIEQPLFEPGEARIELTGAWVATSAAPHWRSFLVQLVSGEIVPAPAKVSISWDQLQWELPAEPLVIAASSAELRLSAGSGELLAMLDAPPNDSNAGEPRNLAENQLRVVFHRSEHGPATDFELHCGSRPLPVDWLLPWVGRANSAGPRCQFAGDVWFKQQAAGWEAMARGRFEHVELEGLLGPLLAGQMTGTATADFHDFRLVNGRITTLDVRLDSRDCKIASAFAEQLCEELGFWTSLERPQSEGTIQLSQLAAGIHVDAEGLLDVTGVCQGFEARHQVLCVDRAGKPIVAAPRPPQPLTAISLVRALAPGNHAVPATREARELLAWLPLPGAEAASSVARDRPGARDSAVQPASGQEQPAPAMRGPSGRATP